MSMSTRVVGVRDLDGQFAKMMQVKLACEAADVDYPEEVNQYFGGYAGENEETLRRDMEEIKIDYHEYSEESGYIYEVNLSKLPKEVKSIRFSNSW